MCFSSCTAEQQKINIGCAYSELLIDPKRRPTALVCGRLIAATILMCPGFHQAMFSSSLILRITVARIEVLCKLCHAMTN